MAATEPSGSETTVGLRVGPYRFEIVEISGKLIERVRALRSTTG